MISLRNKKNYLELYSIFPLISSSVPMAHLLHRQQALSSRVKACGVSVLKSTKFRYYWGELSPCLPDSTVTQDGPGMCSFLISL